MCGCACGVGFFGICIDRVLQVVATVRVIACIGTESASGLPGTPTNLYAPPGATMSEVPPEGTPEVRGARGMEVFAGRQASASPGTSTRPSPWKCLISGSEVGLEPGARAG